MNASVATIIVAFIGLVGTITAALITRPRQAPQPQPNPYWPTALTWASGIPPKISQSLWWGLAGIFLWLLPILGYIVTLPGLFTAIRDNRSPGTRRHAVAGLSLCLIALTLTIINSALGVGMSLGAISIGDGHARGNPTPVISTVSPWDQNDTSAPAPTATDSAHAGDPHAGCQQANDAITTFVETATPTSTWNTWSDATAAVVDKLAAALQIAYDSGAGSAVIADLSALGTDFIELHSDSIAGIHSDSDVSQTNADIDKLNEDCGNG